MDKPLGVGDAAAIQAGLIRSLAVMGLNHWGVARASTYDQTARPSLQSALIAPGSRSVIVFASGGPELWTAFVAAVREEPSRLTAHLHPLDRFVRDAVESAQPALAGVGHRWFFASATARVHLDFRTLAVSAGIGTPSRLGLVIHPDYGPWIGLRAACFVDLDLPETPAVADVCGGCAAPCVTACPGSAFPDGSWDVNRCAEFHQVSQVCARTCDARMACPVGGDARYDAVERLYHYDRRDGRLALGKAVGLDVAADPHEGIGPHWDAWAPAE